MCTVFTWVGRDHLVQFSKMLVILRKILGVWVVNISD